MEGYTDTILKYASDDTRIGLLDNADGTGEVGLNGKEVGRRLAVRFTLSLDNETVAAVRFQVFGCGFTIAACAATAELAEGLPLIDLSTIDAWSINNRLKGLPEERSYCAELAAQALQSAVASAGQQSRTVATELAAKEEEQNPRIRPDDPLYLRLVEAAEKSDLAIGDQRMFAGLFSVAIREPCPLHEALGLDEDSLAALAERCFPGFTLASLEAAICKKIPEPPVINQDILRILLSHVPLDALGSMNQISERLARIIAARTAQPGHLWISMGFFERPQLTEAIRCHLPSLAAANNSKMRWKRYLFKRACDMNGGVMCKSPNCGECSDYSLCFAPDNEQPLTSSRHQAP